MNSTAVHVWPRLLPETTLSLYTDVRVFSKPRLRTSHTAITDGSVAVLERFRLISPFLIKITSATKSRTKYYILTILTGYAFSNLLSPYSLDLARNK